MSQKEFAQKLARFMIDNRRLIERSPITPKFVGLMVSLGVRPHDLKRFLETLDKKYPDWKMA